MKKFENFCKALHNLEDIRNYQPPYDNVVLTGLVSLYQICFEQAWKAMKEAMENEGVNTAVTGSPRSIIKEAYRLHMIDDEAAWLPACVPFISSLFAAFIRRIIDNSVDDSPLFYAKNFPFVFARVSPSQIYSVPR